VSAVRLLIAHHGLMRMSIRVALEGEAQICAEAADAEQAVLEARRQRPEVCIVGWDIAGGGVAAVQGILAAAPDTAVIVLSEMSDVDDLLAAVRAGAVGYLPGSLDEAQLRRVVRGVAADEAAVPRVMVRELIHELRSTTALGGLTEREAQVLGMLRRGHSTCEIAKRLQISPVTVRRYISELVRKFNVDDRNGLMTPEYGADRNGDNLDGEPQAKPERTA
jgi:DNA-binding NarL/FixJ family response regulator